MLMTRERALCIMSSYPVVVAMRLLSQDKATAVVEEATAEAVRSAPRPVEVNDWLRHRYIKHSYSCWVSHPSEPDVTALAVIQYDKQAHVYFLEIDDVLAESWSSRTASTGAERHTLDMLHNVTTHLYTLGCQYAGSK